MGFSFVAKFHGADYIDCSGGLPVGFSVHNPRDRLDPSVRCNPGTMIHPHPLPLPKQELSGDRDAAGIVTRRKSHPGQRPLSVLPDPILDPIRFLPADFRHPLSAFSPRLL